MRSLRILALVIPALLLSASAGRCAGSQVRTLDVPLYGQQEDIWCAASSGQMVMSFLGADVDQCMQVNQRVSSVRDRRRTACDLSRIADLDCCNEQTWPSEEEGARAFIEKDCKHEAGSCTRALTEKAREKYAKWDKYCEPPAQSRSIDCCDRTTWGTGADWEQARKDCLKTGWPRFEEFGFAFETTKERCKEDSERCALSWDELTGEIVDGRPVVFSWQKPDHVMVATGFAHLPAREPEAQKWVLINDPWPPDSGDQSLISWEHYRHGDGYGVGGSHYRDFWKIKMIEPEEGEERPEDTVEERPKVAGGPWTEESVEPKEEWLEALREELEAVCPGSGEGAVATDPELTGAREAAEKALRVLADIERTENASSTGGESWRQGIAGTLLLGPEDFGMEGGELEEFSQYVSRLELANPMPVTALSLDQLLDLLDEGLDGGSFWQKRDHYIFPILDTRGAGPEADRCEMFPVSSVTVRDRGEGWAITRIGRTQLVQGLFLEKLGETLGLGEHFSPDDSGCHGSKSVLYATAPLYEMFVASCTDEEGLTLTPIYGRKFPVGEPIEAARALAIVLEPYIEEQLDEMFDEVWDDE